MWLEQIAVLFDICAIVNNENSIGEVTTLWLYTNMFINIINLLYWWCAVHALCNVHFIA